MADARKRKLEELEKRLDEVEQTQERQGKTTVNLQRRIDRLDKSSTLVLGRADWRARSLEPTLRSVIPRCVFLSLVVLLYLWTNSPASSVLHVPLVLLELRSLDPQDVPIGIDLGPSVGR